MKFQNYIIIKALHECHYRKALVENINNELKEYKVSLILSEGNEEDIQLLWTKIEAAVQKFTSQVDAQVERMGLTPEQKNSIYTNVMNLIMQHGKVALDIPGIGNVNRVKSGFDPRTWNKEKPQMVKDDYRLRIQNAYQELLDKGMNDVEARNELQRKWRGLEDKATLSNILRGIYKRHLNRPKSEPAYTPEITNPATQMTRKAANSPYERDETLPHALS